MSDPAAAREGRIPFKGFETWYRVTGEGEAPGRLPLLTLHGGPGACSDYLEPFEALAAGGRRVIRYDQLGCGKSGIADRPHDTAMWTVDLFVEEVDAVRDALGLDRCHILGQSWGGMLAMEYALTQPEGVGALIIESSPASMHLWVSEANRLRDDLPPDVQATLLEHEEKGTTDSPEYEAAMQVFYDRHVCRTKPTPEPFLRTFECLAANPEVYHYMNGPSEFHVIGTIKDWDVTDRLGEIRLPDARHVRAVRRGHADDRAGRHRRDPGRALGSVREQLAHVPPRGARARAPAWSTTSCRGRGRARLATAHM